MIPYVTIELDKPYKLRLGMAAMYDYEIATGKKIMELNEDISVRELGDLLFAMMRQENRELELRQVLNLIDDYSDNITEIITKISKAITASFGEGEGNPKKPTKSS